MCCIIKSRTNDNLAYYQNICSLTFNHFLTTFFFTPVFKLTKGKFRPLSQNETKQIKNFFPNYN